jgi:glutamine amidotransferase
MQLMTKGSEEGCMPGLGWIEGSAARFDVEPSPGQRLKVPHMGWDEIQIVRRESIFREWMGEARFYFVHSYRVTCSDEKDIVALGRHGHDFVAVFQRDNIVGVQFHPEKSHRFGMQLFQRFAAGIQ